jgi:hypothetical protein
MVCPVDTLEVHAISGSRRKSRGGADLEREILILCSLCHRDVHEAPLTVAEQKEILRSRPRNRRREIKQILNFTPKPYVPPDQDISRDLRGGGPDKYPYLLSMTSCGAWQ